MINGLNLSQLTVQELPSVEKFERSIVPQRRPFLFSGMIDDWPARTLWTRDYFASTVGEAEVPVEVVAPGLPEGYFHADRERGFFVKQMTVRDMIAAMKETEGPKYYMRGVSMTRQAQGLLKDIRPIPHIRPERQVSENFWVGPANAISPLHYDVFDAFLIQVTGRKRVVMLPDAAWRQVYLRSTFSVSPHMSELYLDDLDVSRFPKVQGLHGWDVTINPGEALFIPAGCFHQVWSLDDTISINYWWRYDPFRYLHPLSLRLIPGYALKTAKRKVSALLSRGDSRIKAGSSISEQHYI
jgi:[protein]-arginine 3-hydroxylase / protease